MCEMHGLPADFYCRECGELWCCDVDGCVCACNRCACPCHGDEKVSH